MTYNNISKILKAVHEPISEYEATYIINSMIYGDSYSDKNIMGERINPDHVQRLVDEFFKNANSLNGPLVATTDDKGTGLIISKGETPIFYKGRFLKDQFDNEAMISLLHANPNNGTQKIYEDCIVTRNYIIGKNGLYENSNAYTSFIDTVKSLQEQDLESVNLQYYYYPDSNRNIRLFIDRGLGYRTVEERLEDDKSRVQDFCFDQTKFSIKNLQRLQSKLAGSLTDEELYNEVYSPLPIAAPTVRTNLTKTELAKPKVYQKY